MAFDSVNLETGIPVATANTPFFGYFPTMDYDINNVLTNKSGPHDTITDIFFRVGFLKNVINNISAYYVYDVQEGDTPDLLAEKIYGDRGAAWVILYANNITDPQFDWPLPYDAFIKMIIDKYGSVEVAQTTIHHSEMTITRTNQYGESHSDTYIIDDVRQTDKSPNRPYAYFTPWTKTTHRTADSDVYTSDDQEVPYLTSDLTYDDAQTFSRTGSIPLITGEQVYEIGNLIITESVTGQQVTNYDWELKENDKKRTVKIIKAEYYAQIQNEFKNLTGFNQTYLRKVG
jgi:Base plate wedge protein 53